MASINLVTRSASARLSICATSTLKQPSSSCPATTPTTSARAFSSSASAHDPKSTSTGITIAIRREDPARIWERRCPLTPDAVEELVQAGHRVVVQDCERRVWTADEYRQVGAEVLQTPQFQASDAHIIVGIKETPLNEVLTNAVRVPRPFPPPPTTPSPGIDSWTRRTHVMFSHTVKGQPYNTPLLAKFLAKDNYFAQHLGGFPGKQDEGEWIERLAPRLVDYELLTEGDGGKRSVGFGWFAGVAGVLEALSAMAHAHLESGIASPFLYTPRPHTLPSLEALRMSLRNVGRMIVKNGTPPSLGPFVIGLTGNGNVSQGCLSMLGNLPVDWVEVKDLDRLVRDPGTSLHKIYVVQALPTDYLSRIDGGKFDRDHYFQSPQSYRSDFAEKVAPYLTLFLNGAGWQPSFPRLVTNEQLEAALHKAKTIGGARFTNIGDISCDLEGGLEFMKHASTISSPFYKVRPVSADLPDVQIMSIDILPATIPLDASQHFSEKFMAYLKALVYEYEHPEDERRFRMHKEALKRATVAQGGELVGAHKWLRDGVERWRSANADEGRRLRQEAERLVDPSLYLPTHLQGDGPPKVVPVVEESKDKDVDLGVVNRGAPLKKKKKMLMLGSGMVAGPAVDEIAKRADVQLLIASNSLREVEGLTQNHLNVKYRLVDMADLKAVEDLISEADVVISLLPASLHPKAAELCIQHKKHLVTASYISPEMQSLHDRALAADVLLLNEIGLDPGIDHCSAIDLIERLKSQDKKIKSFISFCGGLPAPDVPHVPFRYKFSWSPRGVLAAALNGAKYKLHNRIWNIPGENILKSYFPDIPITDEFDLEGIANRNSLPYLDTYNLGPVDGMRTVLRGTLRYPGFSKLMDSFKTLGLLETQKKIGIKRWSELVPNSFSEKLGVTPTSLNIGEAIKTHLSPAKAGDVYAALEWLSLLPHRNANAALTSMPPTPREPMAPIDLFSVLLAHKLRYSPNERDMVIMSHEIIAAKKGVEGAEEVHTSKLIVFGDERASAMARTVGLPVAFAALRVIDGEVPVRGVSGPGDKSVYSPILSELERVGLGMKESMRIWTRGAEPPIERALLPVAR